MLKFGNAARSGPRGALLAALALLSCGVQEDPIPPAPEPEPSGAGGSAVVPSTGGASGRGSVEGGSSGHVSAGGGVNGSDGGAPGTGGSAALGGSSASGGRSATDAASPDLPTDPGLPLPPGGPSGPGVNRTNVIAFVHIGHSNMAGRATVPATLHPYFYDNDPRLWSWHGANMVTGTMPFRWRPATEPLSPDPMTGSMAGPGMAILHAAEMIARPDVFLVSTGHGHSGEQGGTCKNYLKGGLLYDIAMGPAKALVGRVTFGGIFTMLGTTERHLDVSAQNGFADCMAQVAADMRGDLGDDSIPFMMSDFEMEATGDTAPTQPYAKIIIAQLRVAIQKIPRSALIPTEMLGMEGSHHFNMAGHKEWGIRGMQVMKDKGWAPWAAP